MKIWYISILGCIGMVSVFTAAPKVSNTIHVQNSNKAIKLQLKNADLTPIAGQTIYVVQPNTTQAIPVPKIPQDYRLSFEFVGLEGYGTVTSAVHVTTNGQLVLLPDQTENYTRFADYKKQLETPEPEAPCIGMGC